MPWWPHRLARFRCRLRLLSVQSPQGGTGVLPVQLFVPHPDPATASCLRRAAPAPSLRSRLGAALGVGLRAGAALRGQTALPISRIAAISRLFGRIIESPADHGHPSRHRARLRLRAASRRAAMVSPCGGLRPAWSFVGGVVGEAIARAASDGPTARHPPPVSCGKRRAQDAPGKLRRGPRAAAAGVLLLISLLASWNWPAAKDKL